MRIIRMPDLTATVTSFVPPGAYVAKFYHEGPLTASLSGPDSHLTGARLIRIVAYLGTASTSGSVVVGVWKNGVKIAEVEILQGETTAKLDLVGVSLLELFDFLTYEPSLEFRPQTDTIQMSVEQLGSGAEQLTVQCMFDR